MCWASGVGRSPTPDRPTFWACSRGPLPTGCGCGECGREDPSSTQQRALLRAGFARCGGGTRAPGRLPLALVWGVWGRALLHARPPVLWGVRPGPTTHWLWMRGVWGWGPIPNPTARNLLSWLCALWGRHEGARGGRLLPVCRVSRVGRSLNPGQPSLGACGRGPLPTGCGCGRCGRGDLSPTSQRALLRAGFVRCGGGERAPGGGASCPGVGRLGSGALPPVTTRPLGHAAGAHYPLAVGGGGVVVETRHQPHCASSCGLALRAVGAAQRFFRGGRLFRGCGASGVGHSPIPNCHSFGACGRGPLPPGCQCGGCGLVDPSQTPQHALLRAGFARCGGGRRVPRVGGGASCLCVWGVRGWALLHAPTARPLGVAAGAHYPLAVGAGDVGVGTRHQRHSARSCQLALRSVGATRGRPGAAPLACVRRPWSVAPPQRPPLLWHVGPGPTTDWL